MSMKKSAEPDLYDIPHNYEDGGGVFGGRFKTRNAIEGIGSSGLVIYIIVKFIPVPMTVRVGLATLFGLPLFILGMFGIGNEPVSSFIFYMLRFQSSKRRLVYRRGYTKHVENSNSKAKQSKQK